jgi:hypothetical protein
MQTKPPEILDVYVIISTENWKEGIHQNEINRRKYRRERVNKNELKKLVQAHFQYHFNLSCGVQMTHVPNRIFLNLSNIKKDSDELHVNFEKHICETISHEIIHRVIDAFFPNDSKPSAQYDNIYRNLRRQGFSGC